MITDTINTERFFAALDETSAELVQLISSTDATIINIIPFTGSWTAAQLVSHVTKSNKAIAQALDMEGAPAGRDPDERVDQLRKTFLDFSARFDSPEFIRPKEGTYQKERLIESLETSIEQLKELRDEVDLSRIISLPAFGEITKFEVLHFVLYHTQRHIHQLKNILQNLKNGRKNN